MVRAVDRTHEGYNQFLPNRYRKSMGLPGVKIVRWRATKNSTETRRCRRRWRFFGRTIILTSRGGRIGFRSIVKKVETWKAAERMKTPRGSESGGNFFDICEPPSRPPLKCRSLLQFKLRTVEQELSTFFHEKGSSISS